MKTCTTCGAEWPDDTKFCPSDGSALKAADGGEGLIGSVLHSYHIIKKLGEGGMGAVYLGEHVKMGRKSAIKVMSKSLAQDTDAIARFNREAANAARINHINVCAIYDFGETDDGTIFLAMEFIEGEALTDLIKREGPLDLQRAGNILKQTSEALQAAHDLGIVHRDLKPDNIMIAKARDGSDLVKVVDFGIAKAMGGEEGQNVTRTGLVVGTPEYMSPEQLSGDKLDGRSDVYSLALVFFRMITGVLPFQAESAQEVMIKRLTDEPTRLNDALDGVSFPPKLQVVLDTAMERMPGDRYAGAEVFANDAVDAMRGAGSVRPPAGTQDATQLLDTGSAGPGITDQLKKTRLSEAQKTITIDEAPEEADGAATTPIPEGQTTPETPMPQAKPGAKKKSPVLAVVASIVVVGAAGGVAAIAFGGGNGVDPSSDSTNTVVAAAPGDSLSTNDGPGTENANNTRDPTGGSDTQALGTNDSNPLDPDPGTEQDRGGNEGLTTQPRISAEDSTRIDEQLIQIYDSIFEAGSRQSAMSQARRYYEDVTLPTNLRGQAALLVAQGYEMNADTARACDWIGRAGLLIPEFRAVVNARQNWGCTP